MKKQIPAEQTDANIREVLRLLAETPAKLESLSKGLTDAQLHQALGAGERSLTEALAHIINCEAIMAEAIYLALLVKEPLLAGIHAERDLGKLLRFDQLPFADLLTYFKTRRTILLHVLESLTDDKWSRCIRDAGKQRKESVYWRARGQALHELEHILDLEDKFDILHK